MMSFLQGQEEISIQNSYSFVNKTGSPLIVNPFEERFLSMFYIDSVTALRGIFQIDHEDKEQWTEISENWSVITFYEAVNGIFFKVPFTAPVDWYFPQRIKQERMSNFSRLTKPVSEDQRQQARSGALELVGVETGVGRASLNISGNVNVSGKMVFQDQELARSNFRESQTSHFEFDQRQNLLLEGKVGERVNVLMDMDSERDVDWENKIKINYTGDEDEIVQRIEAGNVTLSLPSTQFVTFSGSNSGLFGLKSLLKLGPVNMTAIASIEKTRKEKQKFKAGAETQGQAIPDYQYRKNQYFFLDKVFRNGGLILDNDKQPIPGTKGNLAVPSFYPLVDGKHRLPDVVITEIEVFKSVGGLAGAGTFFGFAYIDPNFNESEIVWTESDSANSDKTLGSFFQRLQRGLDYFISEDLGFIRLNSPIQNEILAVSYTLSERPEPGAEQEKPDIIKSIGELTKDLDTQEGKADTIHLKLIKPLTPNPNHPTWPLAFKNVYFLGASNINTEGFEVSILYKNGALGNDERLEGKTLIHLFGLDSLDQNSNPIPDDQVDKMNTNIVNLISGELIFPMLHPFEMDSTAGTVNYRGEGNQSPILESILPDSAFMYRSLDYQRIRSQSNFDIKVSYQNKSATINLGGFMLVEGSEEVYLNDLPLQRGRDYTIDYFSGTLTILTEDINKPNAELDILYDKHELVSFDKKTIVGTRAQMDLGPKSFIGSTALFYNQSVINEKIEVGYEPMRNFIWDLNGRYEGDADILTQAVDKLPLIETNKPSSFRVEGEFAQVLPNPNPVNNRKIGDPNGVAFIDDFEGAKRTSSPSIRRRFWNPSSVPLGLHQRHRARMFWYNPYTQVLTKDIWPNQETSTRAQNHLTDVLVLNYNRLFSQIDSVDPDSNWAGITASLYSSDYNQSQSKFFEIWLLTSDFIEGEMTVDLGLITEDQNENGFLDTEDKPEAGLYLGNTFLEDDEDIGLDGCEDAYEDGYGGCLDTTYQAALELGYDVYYHDDPDDFFDPNDPNGDNFSYDENAYEVAEKYRYVNGTEGDGTSARPLEGARYPDTEDINRDGNFDQENDYFTKTFDLSPESEDWKNYEGGSNTTRNGVWWWRLYRIPLAEFTRVRADGAITWDTIKFMRLSLSSIPDSSAVVRIAKVELVGNEWQELGVRSDYHQAYTRNDSVFAVTVINTEDNQDYARSVEEIGVRGEYDRVYGIRKKEQSLVLKFQDLQPGEEGAAQKNLIELRGEKALSYLTYDKMKLFAYGKGDNFGKESSDVEFFIRLGRSDDYYEISQLIYEGWDTKRKRNFLSINLDFLTGLKLKDSANIRKRSPEDVFTVTDSTRKYIETANEGADTVRNYLIHGSPALSRIQYFIMGVRNKNPSEAITGEIWLDELRLSQVKQDAGTAFRFQSHLVLADLGTATLTYSRKDADFHVLQQRLGTGNTAERFRVDGRLNFNKFFPQSLGLSLPLSLSYTENISTPKYLPGTDILLNQRTAPDSTQTQSQQINMTSSFAKTTQSDRWYTRYTLDRIKTNFSGSFARNSDEQIDERISQNYAGGFSYNLQFGRDNYWTPLKFLKGVPLLGKRAGDTHLYYTPSSMDASLNVSETLTETTPRVGEFKRVYNLGLNRSFKMGYTILENLKSSYSKTIKSDMDSFEGRYLEAVQKLKPGIVTNVTDNMSTSFTPVIFTWLKPSLNYSSNYRWSKPIESTQEGANLTSQTRFSSSVTITPKVLVESFYTPPSRQREGASQRRRRRQSTTPEEETEKPKKTPQNPAVQNFFKLLHSGANKINPISITYSQNRSQNNFGILGTADISYRFGFREELGLEHSAEVGVNRGSSQRQRDISLRSGLSITRRITTNFNFSQNFTSGMDGNNVRRESQTRDFFPRGVRGKKGSPFIGWSVRWSGVETWPLIKILAKSASFEHAFAGKESQSWQNEDLLSSKYTASYSPLAGLSMTLVKGITLSTRFSTVRTIDNRFSGINSTKVKTDHSFTATSNYAHRGGFRIPIFFFRDFNMENTMNFSLTFDLSKSVAMARNGIEYDLTTTDKRSSWKVSPRVSYSFSRTVTGGMWFEYRESETRMTGHKVDRDFGFDVNIAIKG